MSQPGSPYRRLVCNEADFNNASDLKQQHSIFDDAPFVDDGSPTTMTKSKNSSRRSKQLRSSLRRTSMRRALDTPPHLASVPPVSTQFVTFSPSYSLIAATSLSYPPESIMEESSNSQFSKEDASKNIIFGETTENATERVNFMNDKDHTFSPQVSIKGPSSESNYSSHQSMLESPSRQSRKRIANRDKSKSPVNVLQLLFCIFVIK